MSIEALSQQAFNVRIEADNKERASLRRDAIFTGVTGVIALLLAVILPTLHFVFGFSDIGTIAKVIAPLSILTLINTNRYMKKAYK